jgi:hypothetical protein
MKNLLFLALILSSILTVSCTRNKSRIPSSTDATKDLMIVVKEIENKISTMEYTYNNCTTNAQGYYGQLLNINSNDTALSDYNKNDLKELVKRLFTIRLKMRNKLSTLMPNHKNANICLKSVKDLNRAFRYLEDYIVEYLHKDKNKKFEVLSGSGEYFLKNDKSFNSHTDLQSGDIILSRGNAYTSAAIARIGETDAQFSHLTFVYKDELGKLWTTEAHIEIGSVVAPFNVHLAQGNSRSVVYRYHDQQMAHAASKAMFDRVKKNMDTGKNIQYDFGMDYKKDDRLFCSEIISQGFSYASNNSIDVPRLKTRFNPGLIPFLNNMGINVNKSNVKTFETFSPGDIEYDHNFKVIAEWRNPNKLEDSRMKDAVLTKMFEWMENKNYSFKPRIKLSAQSTAYWIVRRLPFLKKLTVEKFPLNMKVKQLKLFLTLDKVGEIILDELIAKQAKLSEKMTPKEMYMFLESVREQDFIKYKKKKRSSKFHKWFR